MVRKSKVEFSKFFFLPLLKYLKQIIACGYIYKYDAFIQTKCPIQPLISLYTTSQRKNFSYLTIKHYITSD